MSPGAVTAEEVADRIKARDTTLWPSSILWPDRFAFLDAPRLIDRDSRALERWAATIDESLVVVLGIGPATDGAAVLAAMQSAFEKPDGREIVLCDTTDPSTISSAPLEDACIVVVSSTGTSIETEALLAHALGRVRNHRRFVVIAPGASPLVSRAEELGVGRIFATERAVPGFFSLLSPLGCIPAALAGYDLTELVGRAMEIDRREAFGLGIELGTTALDGDNVVAITTAPELAPFAHVVARLFALTTGKAGNGIIGVPALTDEATVAGTTIAPKFESAYECAAEHLRLEFAALAAAHVLGVDPFYAPEVNATRAALSALLDTDDAVRPRTVDAEEVPSLLDEGTPDGGYIAVDSYLPRAQEAGLSSLAGRIRAEITGAAVTTDEGARVLHGSGQLHKDGPDAVLVLQLVSRTATKPVAVPGATYDFAALSAAQSDADHERLIARHKRVIRVAVDDPSELF